MVDNAVREGPKILAFLKAAEFQRRIIEAQITDPQLRDEHRQPILLRLIIYLEIHI
jgi:hypothetical protein